ncbi:uncharacterized protein LOC122529581 [Frieseomelitta varia]|uniref:uncharacterized protein LOC122529581 n=1 Tax=Frieseomelitta varia TaxID=561572 RepID=UPI001CB67F43|nr:uncharacterized protein LOC122529581 [Frieseomelitta varia]
MRIIWHAFLHLCVFGARCAPERTTLPITISTSGAAEDRERRPGEDEEQAKKEEEEEEEGQKEIEAVPMTEQVMNPNIKITDVPDVDEASEEWDADWDKNKVIRDVAYYIRAHKFRDYDRRYYKRLEDSPSRLYEEFPKPPLKSLHWEVRRYCDASFVECLKYLETIIKSTALKREDDTVTIVKEQKWNLADNAKQIQAAQKDCQAAQRRDDLTMPPFQGPIERFQWRTTVSYYMCWYTMLGVPELSIFGESCDNYANCQVESPGAGNEDSRADDTIPYACALYSFCPDHCCPMKHIRDMTDCHQSQDNPCYAGNPPEHRACSLNRQENQDLLGLLANQINISCECREPGYEWSSRFGLCVDVNECTRGRHGCAMEQGEICMNLAGGYECVCKFGYVYDDDRGECVFSSDIEEMLSGWEEEPSVEETKRSLIETIVKTIARAPGNRLAFDRAILPIVIVANFWLL